MNNKYIVVSFEGRDIYTTADKDGNFILITEKEAKQDPSISRILRTETEIEEAEDGVNYAISTELVENVIGHEIQ